MLLTGSILKSSLILRQEEKYKTLVFLPDLRRIVNRFLRLISKSGVILTSSSYPVIHLFSCVLKKRGCVLKRRGCVLKWRGCVLKWRGCVLKRRGCVLKLMYHCWRLSFSSNNNVVYWLQETFNKREKLIFSSSFCR